VGALSAGTQLDTTNVREPKSPRKKSPSPRYHQQQKVHSSSPSTTKNQSIHNSDYMHTRVVHRPSPKINTEMTPCRIQYCTRYSIPTIRRSIKYKVKTRQSIKSVGRVRSQQFDCDASSLVCKTQVPLDAPQPCRRCLVLHPRPVLKTLVSSQPLS
jgi:hypothetical protein